MNKIGQLATRLFLTGAIAASGCNLPKMQFKHQTSEQRSSRNAGQGYFGNFERIVPPDDGKEYTVGEIPRDWKIYERRTFEETPEGHVDEKRGIYIEDGYLSIVGVSGLWQVNGEQSAIRDAERNAAEKYGRLLHDLDGDGNFEGLVSGLLSEANELVVVKKDEESALVAEVMCTVPLNRLPADARKRIEREYGGK